jgi:hypothetical protein
MLAVFKGELSYDEIMTKIPKKRLQELYKARVDRLTKERQEIEKSQKQQESAMLQQQILQK